MHSECGLVPEQAVQTNCPFLTPHLYSPFPMFLRMDLRKQYWDAHGAYWLCKILTRDNLPLPFWINLVAPGWLAVYFYFLHRYFTLEVGVSHCKGGGKQRVSLQPHVPHKLLYVVQFSHRLGRWSAFSLLPVKGLKSGLIFMFCFLLWVENCFCKLSCCWDSPGYKDAVKCAWVQQDVAHSTDTELSILHRADVALGSLSSLHLCKIS